MERVYRNPELALQVMEFPLCWRNQGLISRPTPERRTGHFGFAKTDSAAMKKESGAQHYVLLLAQKVEVGITAGTRIDDCGEVTRPIGGVRVVRQ